MLDSLVEEIGENVVQVITWEQLCVD